MCKRGCSFSHLLKLCLDHFYLYLDTFVRAYVKPSQQRALLEQKQKKKRQEPLMVQSNVDGRSRVRRTKQSEEQAPLVESYLNSNSSTIYHGECRRALLWDSVDAGSSTRGFKKHSGLSMNLDLNFDLQEVFILCLKETFFLCGFLFPIRTVYYK